MSTNYKIENLTALDTFCKKLKEEISERSCNFKNQIFFLEAPMGSGKTTFTRNLIKHFNSKLKVSSPTFTGVYIYSGADFDYYHYDLYQVGLNLEELEDILNDEKKKLLFFEWAENLDEDIKKTFQDKDTFLQTIQISVNKITEERTFSLNENNRA